MWVSLYLHDNVRKMFMMGRGMDFDVAMYVAAVGAIAVMAGTTCTSTHYFIHSIISFIQSFHSIISFIHSFIHFITFFFQIARRKAAKRKRKKKGIRTWSLKVIGERRETLARVFVTV